MKKFFYSIITMFLSFNMMNPTFVKASEKREIKSNKNIIIMVDQNSEKRAIIPTQISKTIKNDSQENNFSKECDVELTVPISDIVTYDDMEKTATKRMVKIKGKIVYEPKGKGLIKITKCSGSWKPSSKSIYMTEREMVLHGGRGQHMKKKPKKDSFSYNTDWKAADLVPSTDILGTAMIMTAVARVSGMTAKTTVQIKKVIIMKNFKNIICGFILPILLLIVLPYIGFWLYNQNYIHNYIERSIMNGKYMQEIFVRLVWGILIGIYMLWLNKSSTFMAICSTAVIIIILVCSVLLFMMENILVNNDILFIWSVLPGILIGIWIYKIKQK